MKNKFLIISIVVVILVIIIAIGVWAYKNSQTADTANTSNTATLTSSGTAKVADQYKADITSSMNWIKSDSAWNAEINRKYPINKVTYNQQLAMDAIGALVDQGKVPAEYNNWTFVKANF